MVDPNNQDTLNEALELFHFAFRAFTSGPDAILLFSFSSLNNTPAFIA